MGDRHQYRADWYEYKSGIFFITICSHLKQHIFGNITNGNMSLSPLGCIVNECISEIPIHYHEVDLWQYVIMPNHVHMIISIQPKNIKSRNIQNIGCLHIPAHDEACIDFHHNTPLAIIIGSFKASVTRRARAHNIGPLPCWQTRFHDHIIRNKHTYDLITRYIETNIINWNKDCYNQ